MSWTLPQRLYLLSYHGEKGRLDLASVLVRGQLMRAAAVAELAIGGQLVDQGGKAGRVPGRPAPEDPFLADVLEYVSPDKPRRWFTVVDHRWAKAESTVKDQLAGNGTITVGKGKALGLIPVEEITLGNPHEVTGLRETTRNAVLLGRDPATVPADEAALALFAAEGDVGSVFTHKERSRHKGEFKALAKQFDATVPGVRKALQLSIATRRGAAAG
ncbi:GPP34 family phosphoprotein [Amycolatopsis sp. NBC_00345]|uniref:GOLPH3/VPS74 family protein n=1 Tax=Amycolatopsis sp. NBC_00345 TaxID=2975955 RepID=UPI002E26E9E0